MERRMKHLAMICLLVLGVTSGAEASKHKVLVYRLSGRPGELLDPAKCSNYRCRRVTWVIYENLGKFPEDSSKVLPALASSWEASPDGLTYTLHLRKGVTFHDGTPFNAEAAKINLERYVAIPGSEKDYSLLHLVRGVTVHDEHTLTVTLKHANADRLFRVPMVSPTALAKEGEKYGKHPVGTGPFRFARWTADEIRLAANSEYWGGRPKLDQISFPIINDMQTKMREFLAGHIDVIPFVGYNWLDRVRENPTTRFMRIPTNNVCYMGLYADRKPFQDPRVRQAMARGINIERVSLFLGQGRTIPARNLIPPGADGFDPELKRPPYHPDEAKRLLQEAGYTSGLKITLLYKLGASRYEVMAQTIKADLGRIGVGVELSGIEKWSKFKAKVRDGVGDAFVFCTHLMSLRPEDSLLRKFRGNNLFRYHNAKVRDLLDEARRVKDRSGQIALYSKAHRIILDDAAIIPFYHMIRVAAYNTRVTGLKLNTDALPEDRFLGVDIGEE